MNGFMEKVEITEENIEEMCQLAEDVRHQLHMHFMAYDTEGNDIFNKYNSREGDFETESLQERMAMAALPESDLLDDLFYRGDDIGKVRYYTTEEIRPWIEPIIPKALQMLRKGTGSTGDCPYRAADTVPDSYLIAAFAREVRNRMMISAGQKLVFNARRYLLLREYPETHEADAWRGIYFDNEKLKQAYDALISELEEERKQFPESRARAAIYEFRPVNIRKGLRPSTEGALRAKQEIRPVKPEELYCFQKPLQESPPLCD